MEKKKIILGIIIISILLIAVVIAIYISKKPGEKLYVQSHINYAWGYFESTLEIYDNGLMMYIENSDGKEKKKKRKISNEELNQLKKFALLVEDNYKSQKSDFVVNDLGYFTEKVYNKKIGKWIKLSYFADGGKSGYNDCEETEKILNYVDTLTEKYNILD